MPTVKTPTIDGENQTQSTETSKCCGCCKISIGIKLILALEFVIAALCVFLTGLCWDSSRDPWFIFMGLAIISSLSFISGAISLCKNTSFISGTFVATFSIATIQWLTLIIVIISTMMYFPDGKSEAWIIILILVIYGFSHTYFSTVIYKHHQHTFASNHIGASSYNKEVMIAIILTELTFTLIAFITAKFVVANPTNTYGDIAFRDACHWISFIAFIGVIAGTLTTFAKFNANKTIALIFLISYFIGTVQWFNFTISCTIFEPKDVLPDINNYYYHQERYHASKMGERRLLAYAPEYGNSYAHNSHSAEVPYKYEESSWTPEQALRFSFAFMCITYGLIRCYFTSKIYKYASSLY